MKILVTGVAGFIGHHLVLHLLNQDYEVIGVDAIDDYYDVSLKHERLKLQGIDDFESNLVKSNKFSNYKFLKLDLADNSNFQKLEKYNFDLIIHLAAQAGVRYSITNPQKYIDSNITAFFNILEFARNFSIKKIIYASSSSVYGNIDKVPFNEGINVDKPISLYAATKKSNELMAHVYSHLFNIQTIGMRFFTVYGQWGRPDMAAHIFTKSILNNEPIKLFNYGNNKRDFTFISDIVEAINLIISKIDTLPNYEVYNIGYGKPYSTKIFVNLIEKYLDKKANLVLTEPAPGDVEITYADTSKIKNAVGFDPKVDLEAGLKAFIDWYLSYYK